MTSISSTNEAALLILQQSVSPIQFTDAKKTDGDNLVVIANDQPVKQASGMSPQPTAAQSKISESLFSVNDRSVTQMKLDLIDRAGAALGVKKSNYTSMDEFVAATKKAFLDLRSKPDGAQAIAKIERDLGLDKLGITLEDLLDSADDPDKNDKVTQALKKQLIEDGECSSTLKQDESGRYQLVSA
ncbi:hypothetical protein [Rhizobium sp. CF142]|uniref:hypothetical protein n=1 Tax=Rhizobium sp. CF142 TaxID=1144314 RepID=UPI00026EEF2B|nr:hypothetical protein [Rhizobium sp. CF142]EJJ29010.1 hypothetical protein PMI11_02728 [Rhizobium sp. CF142]